MDQAVREFIRLKWNSDPKIFPGPQPISIERKHLGIFKKNEYLVCAKTDGVRHFLCCFTFGELKICALVNRAFDIRLVSLTVPRDTLLDGELIGNEFIVHDSVCIKGVDFRSRPLNERLEEARKMAKFIIPTETMRVRIKNMVPMARVSEIHLSPLDDGLIMTPVAEPIRMGTHLTMFKWKPLDRITIDFFVDTNKNLCIQNRIIQKNFECKTSNCIVECSFDGTKWNMVKFRTDKSHPNNLRTYERTLVNIRENIQMSEFF